MPTGREPAARADPVVAAPPVLDLATRDAWLVVVTDVLVPDAPPRVRVDMAPLQFVDAAGLGALVVARQRCAAAGTELVLVDTPRHALRLMVITELDRALTLQPATAACGPPAAAGGC